MVRRGASHCDGRWGRRNSPLDSGIFESWNSPLFPLEDLVSPLVEGLLNGWNSLRWIFERWDSPFWVSSKFDKLWTRVFLAEKIIRMSSKSSRTNFVPKYIKCLKFKLRSIHFRHSITVWFPKSSVFETHLWSECVWKPNFFWISDTFVTCLKAEHTEVGISNIFCSTVESKRPKSCSVS